MPIGKTKDNKILTITVPAYNVQGYLEQCLDSFIIEDIMNDIEVLIINDGSSDNTEEIALRYQKNYPGTFKAISKENGGHGSTINRGIEEATGKYFKIVDGDDWVDKAAFLELVMILKEKSADIVATNYMKFYSSNNKISELRYNCVEYEKIIDFDKSMVTEYITMPSMNIKTEILKVNKIAVDEKMFYVDLEYTIFPIPFVTTILFIDRAVYVYRIGAATQSMNGRNLIKNKAQHLHVLFRIIDFYDALTVSEAKKQYIRTRILRIISSHCQIYLNYPLADRESIKGIQIFDKELKTKSPYFYAMSNDDKLTRRLRGASLFSYKYYSALYKIRGAISNKLNFLAR